MAKMYFSKGFTGIAAVFLALFSLGLAETTANEIITGGYTFTAESGRPNRFISDGPEYTIRLQGGVRLDEPVLFEDVNYEQWKAWHAETGANPNRTGDYELGPLASVTLGNGPYRIILEGGSGIVNRAEGSDGLLGFGPLDLAVEANGFINGEYAGVFLENPSLDAGRFDVTIRNRGTIGSYTVETADGDKHHYSESGIEIYKGIQADITNEGDISGTFAGIYTSYEDDYNGTFTLENSGNINGGKFGVSVGGMSGAAVVRNTGTIRSDNIGVGVGRIEQDYIWTIRRDLIDDFDGEFVLENSGLIRGRGIAVDIMGNSAGVSIMNEADGMIGSNNMGIRLTGTGSGRIENRGTIHAGHTGIYVASGTADIIHSGMITLMPGETTDAIRFGEAAKGGSVTLSSDIGGDIRHLSENTADMTLTLMPAAHVEENGEEPRLSLRNIHIGDGRLIQEGGIWFTRDVSANSIILKGGSMSFNITREVNVNQEIDIKPGAVLFITDSAIHTKNLTNRGELDFRAGSITIDGGVFDYSSPATPDSLLLEGGAHLKLVNEAHTYNIDAIRIGGESEGTLTIMDGSRVAVTPGKQVVVGESGTLAGEGSLRGNVLAQDGSTLRPGDPTGVLSIDGNLMLEEGVGIDIRIKGGNDNCGAIEVSGNARVKGGTVRISDVSGGMVRDDAVYTFLTSGSVFREGSFELESQSPLYDFFIPETGYTSNSVFFQADRLADYSDPAYAGTPNRQAVARTMKSIRRNEQLTETTPRLESLLVEILDEDAPESAMSDVLDQLSPDPYQAAFRRVADQAVRLNRQLFQGARQSRLKMAPGGTREQEALLESVFAMAGSKTMAIERLVAQAAVRANAADASAGHDRARILPGEFGSSAYNSTRRVFYGGYGRFGEIDPGDAITGHDFRAREIFLGVERARDAGRISGLALGYGNNEVDFDDNRGELNMHSLRVGPYITLIRDRLELDLALNLGTHFNRQKREMAFLERETVTRFNVYEGTFYSQARYNMPIGDAWLFSPLASLGYTYQYREGFTERRGEEVRLRLDSDTHDSLRGMAGLSAGRQFRGRSFILVPEVFAGWEYDILETDVDVDARFAEAPGSNFTVIGEQEHRDAVLLGIGVTALVGYYNVIFARYEHEISDSGNVNTLAAGVKWNF